MPSRRGSLSAGPAGKPPRVRRHEHCAQPRLMTRKVRVLQLIDQLGEAGAEQLLYTFTTQMDRSRFEIHVCGLRRWPRPKIAPDLRALGYPVVELNQEHAYDLPVLWELVNYIRREKIDII